MLSEDTKILEFNQHKKSDEVSLIIYADLGCVICGFMDVKIILKNLSTTKVSQHIPSCFPMCTRS